MNVSLGGVGQLLGGIAATAAAWNAWKGKRQARAGKEAAMENTTMIKDTVIPAVTNHEHMIASLADTTAMMAKLVPVFIEDYTRRMEERREP